MFRHRSTRAAAAATLFALALPVAGGATTGDPGPALIVPRADLEASLHCSADLSRADREPVLLVPGTTLTPDEHFGWNYMPALDALSWPWCAVTTPVHATGDMQVAAEHVVHAIRVMHERSGRRLAVLGGSQGGSLPRWALRFWPDTRAMVEDHFGLAATNHGGSGVAYYCAPDSVAPVGAGCMPAMWQQVSGSRFAQALNSGQETFVGVDYTEVSSHQDRITTPADVSLRADGGRVTNVSVDDVCPGHVGDHIKVATYDPVGFALVMDGLTHDGPADPARLDRSACGQEIPPGVDPAVFAAGLAKAYALISQQMVLAPRVPGEPPLRCYADASCG